MTSSKLSFFLLIMILGFLSLSFISCGVGYSVETAREIDSLMKTGSFERPQYRIFDTDTIQMLNDYEKLKSEYAEQIDSIRDVIASNPQIEMDEIKLPVHPDSSIFADILYIDDSKWPLEIELGVKVYNHKGESIKGLAPPYLPIEKVPSYWKSLFDSSDIEDCINNTSIESFSVEEIRKDNSKNTAITYLLDHSGSMGETTEMFEKLIRKMVISSKPGDYYSYIVFAGGNNIAQEMTSNLESVKSLFDNKSYLDSLEGGTNIRNSLELAILETSKANDSLNKKIVIMTDGFEMQTQYNLMKTLEKAKANNISIYSMAYGFNNNIKQLKLYADATGGRFYGVINPKEFKFAFADMYLDLSSYYIIKYKPNDCRGFHNVKLELAFSLLDNMVVTAEGNYSKSLIPKEKTEVLVKYIDIRFDTGESKIDKSSESIIKEVADELKGRKNLKIEVIGHTDDVGKEEDNQILSEKRAESVMKKLIEFGIDKNAITYSGEGEANPVSTNTTEEGRAKNRRTELKIAFQ